jgi:hypothetical protein
MNASLDVYATSIGSQGKGNILGFIENEWGGKTFSIKGGANTFKLRRRKRKPTL